MKKIAFAFAASAVVTMASAAQAATVTFGAPVVREPSAAETGDAEEPVPAGAQIVNFFLTSDADILSVGLVDARQGGELFNHSAAGNNARPSSALITAIPPLGADSWIRLAPTGTATILGTDLPGDGTDNSTWGDTVNTLPSALNNFNFAQLTWPAGGAWRFSGQVVVSGATGPESFPFDFSGVVIPEPMSFSLAGFGLLGIAALRRKMIA
jgi:hypothetical protein